MLGKSLEFLPVFTRPEIDNHMNKCGKLKGKTIKKTLVRGLKFKQERYISTDSLFTTQTLKHFIAKCTCRASMKKMIRKMQIYINHKNSQVDKASCSCPAGLSGYCKILDIPDTWNYSPKEMEFMKKIIVNIKKKVNHYKKKL